MRFDVIRCNDLQTVTPYYLDLNNHFLYKKIRKDDKSGVDVDRNSTFGNPTDGNNSTVRGIISKIIF